MENRIINIDISPENTGDISENAGVMWEHNATKIVFNIASEYVGGYKYYLEYRSLIGTKVRTEYLELNTADNTIAYIVPATMSGLGGVECYFNIVEINEDGQTVAVVKPRKFCLQFDYSPDTDNSLAKLCDFSINALLEAIRLGTFKGADAIVDNEMKDDSENAVKSRVVKAYIDEKLGDVGKSLDEIIVLQNKYIGGNAE